MVNAFRALLIAALATIAQGYAQISQASVMDEVIKTFQTADQETLALFDIDMVILQPEDPAFQMANMKRFSSICKKIVQQLPADKKDIFLILTSVDNNSVLIDAKMPELIGDLTRRKVPTMALTGNFTGKFGVVENMEQWKIAHLLRHGIDFSVGAPSAQQMVFDDLPAFRQNYSTYMQGILFVNGSTCSKGDALIAFLKKTNHRPKKVIFIDDREDNLKSVEAALKQFDPSIVFTGLHFTGAKDYPSPVLTEQQFESRWQQAAQQAMKTE